MKTVAVDQRQYISLATARLVLSLVFLTESASSWTRLPIELGTLVSRFDPTCTKMIESETARQVENTRRRTATASDTEYIERRQRGQREELFVDR